MKIKFGKIGKDCQISSKASFYNPEKIFIGNHVRIDDFCILSAGCEIFIGDYVHIGAGSKLLGHALIELRDFSGVSLNCVVLSSNADYSGAFLTNPQIPEDYLNTYSAPVVFGKHALIGTGTIVLPGVALGEGACVGACSLVKSSIPDLEIWGGVPARYIRGRKEDILKLEYILRYENSKHRGLCT